MIARDDFYAMYLIDVVPLYDFPVYVFSHSGLSLETIILVSFTYIRFKYELSYSFSIYGLSSVKIVFILRNIGYVDVSCYVGNLLNVHRIMLGRNYVRIEEMR